MNDWLLVFKNTKKRNSIFHSGFIEEQSSKKTIDYVDASSACETEKKWSTPTVKKLKKETAITESWVSDKDAEPVDVQAKEKMYK